MALKDIFTMVKADRYTQDGREQIIKAQKAETEDARRTYQIGEISEATGLQKTAQGWKPPKGNGGSKSKPSTNEDYTKMDGMELSDKIKEQSAKVKQLEEKGKSEKNGFRRQAIAQEYVKEKSKLNEMNKALDTPSKGGAESKPLDPDKKLAKEIANMNHFSESKKEAAKARREEALRQERREGEARADDFRKKVESGEIKYNEATGRFEESKSGNLKSKDPQEIKRSIKPETEFEAKEMDRISNFVEEETGADLGMALQARESYYKNMKNPTPEQQKGLAALMKIEQKLGYGKKSEGPALSGQKKTISHQEYKDGPLYGPAESKPASDSAPRALTGDCKVRVKK